MKDIINAFRSAGKPVVIVPREGEVTIRIEEVNWPDLFPYCPETHVRISRDEEFLTLIYHVHGEDLRALYTEDHGNVWTDSCCEFFCQPMGHAYYNFEINPIGTMTASVRTARKENVQKLNAERLSMIARLTEFPREVIEEQSGMHDWSVGMRIPIKWTSPTMRVNFYKCGDKTAHPHYVSWAPINSDKPDFHRPECFGLMVLE